MKMYEDTSSLGRTGAGRTAVRYDFREPPAMRFSYISLQLCK